MTGAPGNEAAGSPARRPRRDAARNRRLLLQAAMETFRDEGPDVALDAIARRAGVGNATLYRHFPTRESLYDAVFADVRGRIAEVLARYADVTDARAALHAFIADIYTVSPAGIELGQLADRHVAVSPVLAATVGEVGATLSLLLRTAQEQGGIRPDVDVADLGLLLTSLKPVMAAAGETAPDVWHRHLALLLDALRPEAPTPLPPLRATPEQRARVSRSVHDIPAR